MLNLNLNESEILRDELKLKPVEHAFELVLRSK